VRFSTFTVASSSWSTVFRSKALSSIGTGCGNRRLRPRTKSSSTSTSTSSGIGTMGIHGIGISTNPLQDALSGFSSPRSSSPITEGGSSPPSDDGSSMSSSSSLGGNLAAMAPTPEKSLQQYPPPPPDSPPIALKGMQHSESTRQLPATMEEVQKALPQSAMPEPEQMLTIRTFPSV